LNKLIVAININLFNFKVQFSLYRFQTLDCYVAKMAILSGIYGHDRHFFLLRFLVIARSSSSCAIKVASFLAR
jgi:hypothetical protein